jgi:hypothetical protein
MELSVFGPKQPMVNGALVWEIPKLPDRGPRSQMEGGCLSRNLNSNQEVVPI